MANEKTHFGGYWREVAPIVPQARAILRHAGVRGAQLAARRSPTPEDGARIMTAATHVAVEDALASDAGYSLSALLDSPTVAPFCEQQKRLFAIAVMREKGITDPGLAAHIGASEAMSTIILAAQMAMFRASGQHSYEVSPELAERLAATELRHVRASDLKLPHKSLFLHTPRELGYRLYNHFNGWQPLDGVYLMETEYSEDGAPPTRRWMMFYVTNDAATAAGGSAPWTPATTSYFSSSIELDGDGDIETAIEQATRRLVTLEQYGVRAEEIAAEWRRVFSWILNVMMYATWSTLRGEPPVGIVRNANAAKTMTKLRGAKGKHAAELRERLYGQVYERYALLGANTTRLSAPGEDAERTAGGVGAALAKRTLVSGFWRVLVPGPGKPWKEHKIMWIEPFWRGPEDAPRYESTTHKLEE